MLKEMFILITVNLGVEIIKLICKKSAIEYKGIGIIINMFKLSISFISLAVSYFDTNGGNIDSCYSFLRLFALINFIDTFKEIKKVISDECKKK